MQNTAIEIWVYGVIMILGGIMGFVKVGSKASLISGVGMGLALLASGFGVWGGSADSLVVALVIVPAVLATAGSESCQPRSVIRSITSTTIKTPIVVTMA